MMIVKIIDSPIKNKRFRVFLNNNKYYDFGLKNGNTFIDHFDKQKRLNYRKRHYGNKKEKYLIDNLIPSPALFSYYLLWGDSNNLFENIDELNKLLNK
jgi:hypothetical protein